METAIEISRASVISFSVATTKQTATDLLGSRARVACTRTHAPRSQRAAAVVRRRGTVSRTQRRAPINVQKRSLGTRFRKLEPNRLFDPLAHPGMTNKSGASRACETPAFFG